MKKKIFLSSLLTALTALIAFAALIMGILFERFENEIVSELKSQSEIIARALEYDENFMEKLKLSDNRATLISPDGTVIADTLADAALMENHSEREEFIEAKENGSAVKIRYSSTLTETTIYYAALLENGCVLRVSATQEGAFALLAEIILPILTVIAFSAAISALMSVLVSRAIVKPINEIDPDAEELSEPYEELSPLVRKLRAQKLTIEKQLEEARRSREEFRLITENMSEGFLMADKDFKLLTCNSSAMKILKIKDCVNGENLSASENKELIDALSTAFSAKRAEQETEMDGKIFSLIANPVFDLDEVIAAVVIIIDVTESRRREQLRREFSSNVSHELKTPLTSVSGFAEMMKDGGVSEKEAADFSKIIYDESQRLISIVNDITKLSRLDEGGEGFAREKADLLALSEETAARLKPLADKNNVSVKVSGESASIDGVYTILDEMVYNLLENAVKYNKSGGEARITVRRDEKNKLVLLTVEDNGIGIPEREQSRVFERFYRVDKSRSRAMGGTGLGLSIVKHGAALHGASVELSSKENVGTKITVKFSY